MNFSSTFCLHEKENKDWKTVSVRSVLYVVPLHSFRYLKFFDVPEVRNSTLASETAVVETFHYEWHKDKFWQERKNLSSDLKVFEKTTAVASLPAPYSWVSY